MSNRSDGDVKLKLFVHNEEFISVTYLKQM